MSAPTHAPDAAGEDQPGDVAPAEVALPAAARRPQRRRRGRRLRGLLSLAGLLLGAAAIVAGAVVTTPLPPSQGPAAASMPHQRAGAALVCPGPLRVPSADGATPVSGGTVRLSALASASVGAAQQDPPTVTVGPLDAESSETTPAWARGERTLRAAAASSAPTGPSRVQAAGAAGATPAALQTSVGGTGLARGLSAHACQPAVSRAWLVGGATVAGHATYVVLSNPAARPAQVRLRVLGPGGATTLPDSDIVTVAAGSQEVRSLEALAPALAATAVEVTALTGRVGAVVHDSVVRGVTAGGGDDIGPGATPRRTQVVPGVVVSTADRSSSDDDGEGDDGDSGDSDGSGGSSDDRGTPDAETPGATVIRVGVVGSRPAAVRIRLLGPEGPQTLPGGAVAVPAGAVRDVVVQGVPDGTYAAVVEADVPVIAGALSGRTAAGGALAGESAGYGSDVAPSELSWSAAATDLPGGWTPIPVPRQGSARLSVTAPARGATLLYRVVAEDGSLGPERSVTVPAGSTVDVAQEEAVAGLLVRAQGRLTSALVITDRDARGPLQAVVPYVAQPAGGVAADRARPDPLVGLLAAPGSD
ncbi:MAG: DUF5719 family protein [Kineosporiaceae bacterium]